MKRLILIAVAFLTIFNFLAFCQVDNTKSKQIKSEIIVLPEHERNFERLMNWLQTNSLFKDKTSFIQSIRETFNFAKAGNLEKYAYWLRIFNSELSKLDTLEMKELLNFALASLTPVKSKEVLPAEVPGCEADCLLTSCRITCLSGTKPKCQCHFFFADCGCEPYQ